MANYPQEFAQKAVCQSYTGHMTGLWFLPTRPLRLNTNEWMIIYAMICGVGGLLNIKCVVWLSLQLLSETFLILRRNERDIFTNAHRPWREVSRYSCPILMKLEVSRQVFEKRWNTKFHQIRPVAGGFFHAERETETDTSKLTFTFRNFANARPLKTTRNSGYSKEENISIQNFTTNNSLISNVYWTVHHCNSWRMKDQLDVTCYFISLMCSTCFGH